MYKIWGKQLIDVAVAVTFLIIFFPILVVIALLVRLDSSGPIFFKQERLGRNGTIFSIYKFRTMTDCPRIPNGEIIGYHPEITRIGYWLRRFKIDELPQLLNVVKGDMSLVGPRPALPLQYSKYTETALKRTTVCPGLTGLAQIHGNIHLSWPDRWKYDVQYVEQLSFFLDIKIVIRTIAVVLCGEQIFFKNQTDEKISKG